MCDVISSDPAEVNSNCSGILSCRNWRRINDRSDAWFSGRSSRPSARGPGPRTSSPAPHCQRLSKGQSLFSWGSSAHPACPVPVTGDGAHAQHPELFALRASLTHLPNHLDVVVVVAVAVAFVFAVVDDIAGLFVLLVVVAVDDIAFVLRFCYCCCCPCC